MGFPQSLKLRFEPNDRVIDIYRSLYGGKTPVADAMECEDFLEELAWEFEIHESRLIAQWREDITLKDLYRFVHDAQLNH